MCMINWNVVNDDIFCTNKYDIFGKHSLTKTLNVLALKIVIAEIATQAHSKHLTTRNIDLTTTDCSAEKLNYLL